MSDKVPSFDDVVDVPMQCDKCRHVAVWQPVYEAARDINSEVQVPEYMAWPCPRCGHRVLTKCADAGS